MAIYFKPFMTPTVKRKLLCQNPGRVKINSHEIRAKVRENENDILFHLLRGKYTEEVDYVLAGNPYRVLAFEADLPFISVGWFDYRIVENTKHCVTDTRHDRSSLHDPDNVALRVMDNVRGHYRGIGSALISIGFNHAASQGIKRANAYDVLAPEFFARVCPKIHIFYDTCGDYNPYEDYSEDPEVKVNMGINISRPKYIPRIEISLRTEPILPQRI